MNRQESIIRHSLTVRFCHWMIAASGLMLIFSGIGFMPLYGRYYINDIPGMRWVSNSQVQMDLHYYSAAIFLAVCLFHLLFHWRRREFALLPRRGDLRESWQIIKAMLKKGQEPMHDKFLAEQRIAYAVFVFTILVLVFSGYLLAVKNSFLLFVEPQILQVIILTHHAFTYLFMLQVVLHLAAFLIKANRPLLPTMFHGRAGNDYVISRHPKWLNGRNNIKAKSKIAL